MKCVILLSILVIVTVSYAFSEDAIDSGTNLRPKRYHNWWEWYKRRHRPRPTCVENYDENTQYCCKYRYWPQPQCCRTNYAHNKTTCAAGAAVSYTEDKCDCASYYKCDNGNLEKMRCPPGGAFNSGTSKCDEVVGSSKPEFCGDRPLYSMVFAKYNIGAYDNTTSSSIEDPFDATALGYRGILFDVLTYIEETNSVGFGFSATRDDRNWYVLTSINSQTPATGKRWKIRVNWEETTKSLSEIKVKHGDYIRFEIVTAT